MKLKFYLSLIILIICFVIKAESQPKQDTVVYWKHGGFSSLNLNQVQLTNWAKGGESSISATALFNIFANYADSMKIWENSCDLGYGLLKQDGSSSRKNEDKIDINSKFGYKAAKELYYSALMNFKSQFQPGYNYPNDSVIVSKFFSPAYLIISIGLDWKPTEYFSLYISPATGKYIFISDQTIADAGAFTGEPAKYDTAGNVLEHGTTFKPDFGAYLNAKLKIDIVKNVNLESKLSLFNNYTDKNKGNRGNISTDWENNIVLKINSFISANIFVHLIYDHYTKIPLFETINGVKTQVGEGPRLQVKEAFGLGFFYKF